MEYNKLKLHRILENVPAEGWTRAKVKDLVDSLWRDPFMIRWSGFVTAGGTDSVISWNNTTKLFSIAPVNHLFEFFQFRTKLTYYKIIEEQTIDLSEDIAEGLYLFYIDNDPDTYRQTIQYKHNPTDDELKNIFLYRTMVATLYWDVTAGAAIYFGDDRFGSLINPHQQWLEFKSRFALRNADGGLAISGYTLNADGSADAHITWQSAAGKFWHGDILIDIAAATSTIPVMYWNAGNVRFATGSLPVVTSGGVICHNNSTTGATAVTSGKFVMYHAFATNDTIAGHHVIAVMGRAQYDSLADAFAARETELISLLAEMPQTGKCLLATFFYEVNSSYTNSAKTRMVGIAQTPVINNESSAASHPPVTIATGSKDYLNVDDNQQIEFIKDAIELLISETITEEGGVFENTATEIIKQFNSNYKQAYLIENTTATTYEQLSNWAVTQFNEQVGTFEVKAVITNKDLTTITELKNTMGFDNTGGIEIADDNEIVTDTTITLALAIDATTKKLKATVANMPTDAKRIYFCFERCVLSSRPLSVVANMEIPVDMSAEMLNKLAMQLAMNIPVEMQTSMLNILSMQAGMSIPVEMSAALVDGNPGDQPPDLTGLNIFTFEDNPQLQYSDVNRFYGQQWQLQGFRPVAVRVYTEVVGSPDYYYRARFYGSYLSGPQLAPDDPLLAVSENRVHASEANGEMLFWFDLSSNLAALATVVFWKEDVVTNDTNNHVEFKANKPDSVPNGGGKQAWNNSNWVFFNDGGDSVGFNLKVYWDLI